jgi:hypothetical protein
VSAMDPDDTARLREAFASLSDGRADGGSADTGRIFDAVHGGMSVEARRTIVEELVTDADAAEAWRLARELAPEPVPAHVAPRQDAWKWLPIAAALVLAVGLGWRLFSPGGPTPAPGYRGAEQRAIASALPQDVPLSRARPTLRWTALENARYRVRVLTPELAVLVESGELTSPAYTLSDEVLRRVAPGALVLWQVEARMPDNAVIVSPTFSVRLE